MDTACLLLSVDTVCPEALLQKWGWNFCKCPAQCLMGPGTQEGCCQETAMACPGSDCSPDCSIGVDMLVRNGITREDAECTKHDYKVLGAMVKGMMAQGSFSVIFLGERGRFKDDWKDPVGKQLFVDLVSSPGIKLSLPFLRIWGLLGS